MNRSAFIGAAAIVLAAGTTLTFYLLRPESEPVSRPAPAAAAPAPAEVREAPAPEPPPVDAPAQPRRAAAPPAPPPAAPPTVVEAPPERGTLRIAADVPGAQVFLDRRFVGTAPVVAENVAPGTHQLNVVAAGFDSFAGPIEVAPGPRDIVVKFREVRLDAAVDVIHRHGIGSCRGRLVATPGGLRYETAHEDDGFTTALLDLETFEVDYLDKNLRLKVRRGRQYNFTDPDGNADRLFVFHRDVERARERLRRGDQPAAD